MGLHEIQNLLYRKGNWQQKEKTAHRMQENPHHLQLGISYLEYIKNSKKKKISPAKYTVKKPG